MHDATSDLIAAAAADGIDLRVRSAYRSFSEQEWTFAYWVSELGEEQAERESARPGYELVESFADTGEGRWLAGHASEFGFALSYPPGAESITGYIFELWHHRYIGEEAAAAWAQSGQQLVVFLSELATANG